MTPRQGRGRPVVFDADARTRYLAAVTTGIPLAEAAASVGVVERTVRLVAQTDPQFAAARKRAQAAGRQARIDQLPHDEYRYIHHHCHCDVCTKAATEARAGRRDRASRAPVLTLDREAVKPKSFSLLEAAS